MREGDGEEGRERRFGRINNMKRHVCNASLISPGARYTRALMKLNLLGEKYKFLLKGTRSCEANESLKQQRVARDEGGRKGGLP